MKTRRWYNYWPFLIAIFEIIFNIDWVVIPILVKRGMFFDIPVFPIVWDLSSIIPALSSFEVFFIAAILSALTTIVWYWFWGWLGKLIVEIVKKKEAIIEAFKLGQQIKSDPKAMVYIKKSRNILVKTFNWATDKNNWYLRLLKSGGYLALLILSSLPISGPRIVATIFCRTLPKKSLIVLISGDTIKTAIMVYGFWNFMFWFFS